MKYFFSLFLLIFSRISFAADVDTITIRSKALNENSKCVVIIPYSYKVQQNRYPTVYLLHGYSGRYTNWISRAPKLKQYADEFQMIIVCPDGKNSWYIDSKNVAGSNYDTYVSAEIPHFIDSAYRTIPSKDYRAIAGLSMGGHGALYLAFRHPEIFGAAGSMSGVLDLVPWKKKYGIENIIGDTSDIEIKKYSDIDLVKSLKNRIPLTIDCGVNDPFINANRNMHSVLLSLGYPHDYTERDGTHNWDYWRNAVAYQLLFFRTFFDRKTYGN